jgi:hypothetical protein
VATADSIGADRLRALLDYAPEAGSFTWKVNRGGRIKAGDAAGHRTTRGYIEIFADGRRYWAHRLAWLHVHGAWPEGSIDHLNGDSADNRIANLRDATALQNAHNRSLLGDGRSGYTGVSSRPNGRFEAAIKADGRRVNLGQYATLAEATAAYRAAKIVLHGPLLRA